MKTVLQITVGILLAGLIAFGVRLLLLDVFMDRVDDRTQSRIAALQAEQTHRQQQEQLEKQRTANIERQRQVAAAKLAAQERAKREAFDEQYLIPKGCAWPTTEKKLIECTNHKLAARTAFYENYPHRASAEQAAEVGTVQSDRPTRGD